MDITCPRCGSIDVCQDFIDLRPVKTYGWTLTTASTPGTSKKSRRGTESWQT